MPRLALPQERERRGAQALDTRGIGNAEHDGHDHLERDRLHVGVRSGRASMGPTREGLLGLTFHGRLVALERLTVERGQLHTPLAHVLGAVDVRDPGRPEHERMRRGLGQRRAEPQHVRVGAEDAFDVLGIGEAKPRPCCRHRHLEAVTERLAAAREALGRKPVLRGVDQGGPSRAGHVDRRMAHQYISSYVIRL
jgi:hypothetical protein